jgi:hypothetical protein
MGMDRLAVQELQKLEAEVAAKIAELPWAVTTQGDYDARRDVILPAVQALLAAHNRFYEKLALVLDDQEWFKPQPLAPQVAEIARIHAAAGWPRK